VEKRFLFLKTLYLRNFRNYEEASLSFKKGINVIFGNNAQGKTNLLEAISIVSTGRSFRTQHLTELVQEGKSFFYLEAEVVRDNVEQIIRISFDGKTRKLQLDANEFATFSPLLGAFPSILSTPDDTQLITDSPAIRRHFLNLHLAQSDPLYVHHLSRFWRAMKQRNCLLKSKNLEAIECWENEMAHSAVYLFNMRKAFVEQIQAPLLEKCLLFSSNEESSAIFFQIGFLPDLNAYLQQLKKMRNKEQDLGFTLHGPHRDDLSFSISEKSARTFASEGQKKTIVTALRLVQWQHLAEISGISPWMAIDDFGDSLDSVRKNLLSSCLQSMGQVFLTTPFRQIDSDGHLIHIEGGKISRVNI